MGAGGAVVLAGRLVAAAAVGVQLGRRRRGRPLGGEGEIGGTRPAPGPVPMWSSNSSRNFAIIEPIGIAIASPSTHRQLPMMCSCTEAMISRSIGVASPDSIRSSIFTVQLVPSRQGVHLPHDSWR